jgi:adenylate cyclase
MNAEGEQLKRYAADLAAAHAAERAKRRDLAKTNSQLRKYAEDINAAASSLRAAYADLERAHELNEAILTSTSNGILALDLDGRVIKTNSAADRILHKLGSGPVAPGSPVAELLPETDRWLRPSLERARGDPGGDRLIEHRLRRRSRSVTANIAVTAMHDRRGNLAGYILGIEDVSLPRHLAAMLCRYMSKPVADALIDRQRHLLGGASQRVTIMFADIRGFTAMSESAGAEATVTLLNEYFSEIVKEVFKRGGVLDKYIGDAIMAAFGVPVAKSRDPVSCVGAAIHMVRNLTTLNARRRARGAPTIEIGVGIDTGDAVVGNIGCEQRMDFTVIGDTVNVASRLEAANKIYGTTILVSERTAPAVARQFALREIDSVLLLGKRKPLKIYEVLLDRGEGAKAARGFYAKGLAAYRNGAWASAEALFRSALEAHPTDAPSTTMLGRCQKFKLHAPSGQWAGVWAMESK